MRNIKVLNEIGGIDREMINSSRVNYWVGKFRISRYKREADEKIKRMNRDSLRLLTEYDTKSSFGIVLNGIKKNIQKLKLRETLKP